MVLNECEALVIGYGLFNLYLNHSFTARENSEFCKLIIAENVFAHAHYFQECQNGR